VLREHGFEVKLAVTVTEALREIGSHRFDILIADLNVSEPNDGFKVVADMRRRTHTA
jgi:DNA-binding response OmpR family regulator